MKRIALVLAGILLFASAVQVRAFDGQRKGFILGGGLGLGMSTYSAEGSPRFTEFALMTDFKIGYAPSEQVEVFYSSKVSWFEESGTIFSHGLGSVAVNYFLNPEQPFYLSGGVGFSNLSDPFESNSETWWGVGFFGGAGYEFSRHYAVQFDLMVGFPQESGFTFNFITPRVLVIATAF